MKITTTDIIGQLERLAEAFPWDNVELDAKRSPEGSVEFVAYIPRNDKFGFDSAFGSGNSPEKAVTTCIQSNPDRDPGVARDKKMAQLKEQIEKLQAVVIGMPPYRPNRELSNGDPAIRVNETVDV